MKGKKTGGRVKGTPNKDNPLKGYIRAHSVKYFTEIVKDDLTQFEIDQINLARVPSGETQSRRRKHQHAQCIAHH